MREQKKKTASCRCHTTLSSTGFPISPAPFSFVLPYQTSGYRRSRPITAYPVPKTVPEAVSFTLPYPYLPNFTSPTSTSKSLHLPSRLSQGRAITDT